MWKTHSSSSNVALITPLCVHIQYNECYYYYVCERHECRQASSHTVPSSHTLFRSYHTSRSTYMSVVYEQSQHVWKEMTDLELHHVLVLANLSPISRYGIHLFPFEHCACQFVTNSQIWNLSCLFWTLSWFKCHFSIQNCIYPCTYLNKFPDRTFVMCPLRTFSWLWWSFHPRCVSAFDYSNSFQIWNFSYVHFEPEIMCFL